MDLKFVKKFTTSWFRFGCSQCKFYDPLSQYPVHKLIGILSVVSYQEILVTYSVCISVSLDKMSK